VRILHLSYDQLHNPWVGGGGAKIDFEVYRRLVARHEVTLLVAGWRGGPTGQTVGGVPYRFARPGLGRVGSRFVYAARAAAEAASGRYDVVVDSVSPFSPTFSGGVCRCPCVAVLYGHPLKIADKYPRLKPAVAMLFRQNLRRFRHFIALSPDLGDAIRLEVGSGPRIEVIPPGVDADLFEQQPVEEPYLLSLGRLDIGDKGLDCLVDAYALVAKDRPDVRLVIAGSGPDEAALRRMIGEKGLEDRVTLPGRVEGQAKADLLRKCLAVCMPSRREGWGIVATEAGACGKAVVGFSVGGLRSAVADGETGLLVPREDVPALADAIGRVLADDDLRHTLGRNARARAEAFTWDAMAEKYERFLGQACARGG